MKNLFFIILIAASIIYAGDVSRKGTTGADQLLIPVGARSIATGGAFLSNTFGVEAIYYNPAGLDLSKRTEAMFSFMQYIADINVSYFAAGASLGELGSFGLSYKSFDFGDIPVTTNNAPDGTGAVYSPAFYTMGLTYSKIITDRVSIGVTAKFIHEGIMSTAANAFAADFGVQYRFPENLSLAVAVKNIGTNMRYGGQDLQAKTGVPDANPGSRQGSFEAVTEEFQLPSYFEMSAAWDQSIDRDNSFIIGGNFRNNNAMEDLIQLGGEYSFRHLFFLRAGYEGYSTNSSGSIYGLSFGAGIKYPVVEGFDLAIDYAFRDVKDFPKANHIFTLRIAAE